MEIKDFLENPGGQKFEVDLGLSLIKILQISYTNQNYLRSILKRQLETQELIKGNTILNENVSEKMAEIENLIYKFSDDGFQDILNKVLK
jgi:hypothetical protein